MKRLLLTTLLLFLPLAAHADAAADQAALNCWTFERALAGPGPSTMGPTNNSYIEMINPADSGVYVFIDSIYAWPGLPGLAGEEGMMYYATPFNDSHLQGIISAMQGPLPVFTTVYDGYCPLKGKLQLYIGGYPGNLEADVHYFWQGGSNATPSVNDVMTYPIVLGPSQGVVFVNEMPGYENKIGFREREIPIGSLPK